MLHPTLQTIITRLPTISKSLLAGAVLCCLTPVLGADEGILSPEPAVQQADVPVSGESFVAPIRLDVAIAAPDGSVEEPQGKGYRSLLQADSSLAGWTAQDGRLSCWSRQGDVISCITSGGGWLRTEEQYSDFILRLEYRLEAGGNSGIGVRMGPGASTPLEVQLLDDGAPKYTGLREDQYTGSLYYQVAASRRAKLSPAGEWNQCEVRCLGDQVRVRINGETVNEIDLSSGRGMAEENKRAWQLSQRPPLGHIALQSHNTRVDFRNLEIQDLTTRSPNGLAQVDIENGAGEPTTEHSVVKLHYVGQLASGKRFVDTRDVGEPVAISMDKLIPGLQQGICGMRAGGRRRVIVPASLGYGSQRIGDEIPPDAVLVYEVSLVSIEK